MNIKRANDRFNPKYGRLLDDFRVGDVYHHPWEVTLDEGLLAMFAASFLDPNPLYSSRRFALEMGFRDRVVPPLVLLNLALSFSVHDVSEQTIANLGYLEVTFPHATYPGDTLSASSEVLDIRQSKSKPARGIVRVRTVGVNQDGSVVVSFERNALIPAGTLAEADQRQLSGPSQQRSSIEKRRAVSQSVQVQMGLQPPGWIMPPQVAGSIAVPAWRGRPGGLFEDYEEGDFIIHSTGHTIGESEHMQLALLSRNSHPLHTDEVYSAKKSLANTRIVDGGLVFAWVVSLASRDAGANALWELRFERGRHLAPVLGGDTLYAASKVVEKCDYSDAAGVVRFRLVGVKNVDPMDISESGIDLMEHQFEHKVFDVERAVLLPRRAAVPFKSVRRSSREGRV